MQLVSGDEQDDWEQEGCRREPIVYEGDEAVGDGDDSRRDDSDEEGQAKYSRGVGADEGGPFARGAVGKTLRSEGGRAELDRDDEDHGGWGG